MSPQQQDTLTSHIAARLWVLCFALLLASLPIASYAKTGNAHSTSGLVNQLDARTVLHDNLQRLCLKSAQSEQTSADSDSTDNQAINPASPAPFKYLNTHPSVAEIFSAQLNDYDHLRPYLRAPPLS